VADALRNYYFNPSFGKEEWAPAAQFIRAREEPGELIILHSGFVSEAFLRYYGTSGSDRVKPSEEITPQQVQTSDRLWVVLAHADDAETYYQFLTQSHRVVIDTLFPHQSGIRVLELARRREGAVPSEGAVQ
jgi:hypothetical protein